MNVAATIISALALILSLVNMILLIRDKNKNFSVRFTCLAVPNHTILRHNQEVALVKIGYMFANHSQLPIAITRICLMIEDDYYDVDTMPHVAETSKYTVGREVVSEHVTRTTVLPIQLSALGADSGYLAFYVPEGALNGNETSLNFQICTNRGNPVEAEFQLQEEKRFTGGLQR